MCLAHPLDPVVRPGAVENHHRRAEPSHSITNPLGEQLMPSSRRQSCRASRRDVLEREPELDDDPHCLRQRQEVRSQVRLSPTGVRDQSREVTHPRTVAADQKQARTLGCRSTHTSRRRRLIHSNSFRLTDQLHQPLSMSLITKPSSHYGGCARHDLLIGNAIGIQAAQHRRHLDRFGIDRSIAEQRAKMWWQDRRKTAGHRLQNVAPERLHPRRMMEIDKKVQLSQEPARINSAKRSHLPRIRHVTQHLTYWISTTQNLHDG